MSMYPRVTLQYFAGSGACLVLFGALRALKHTPGTTKIVTDLVRLALDVDLPKETYWDTLFSWKMYRSVTASIWMDLAKTAHHGAMAPNPHVLTGDVGKERRLLDLASHSRPLVLNFGSATCPVFVAKLAEFEKMKAEYSDVADFLVVYIAEAHPQDGWALNENAVIRQHRSLKERREAANRLELLSPCSLSVPVVLDSYENEANQAFGALPVRLYVLQGGRVVYQGGMGPMFYRMPEVERWLNGWRERKTLGDQAAVLTEYLKTQ